MRSCICLVTLLGFVDATVRADEPRGLFDGCAWNLPSLREAWRQRFCWCPDDYACKSLPTVPANARGCVDDYCQKLLPCVPANARGCVDDYAPRKCPIFLGKLCEPWYRRGPAGDTGAGPCQAKP